MIQDLREKIAQMKAKFWLRFVKCPAEELESFKVDKLEYVEEFLLFEISKNYYDLKRWSEGGEWFYNPEYPKKFKTKINAYELVLNDLDNLISIRNKMKKKNIKF